MIQEIAEGGAGRAVESSTAPSSIGMTYGQLAEVVQNCSKLSTPLQIQVKRDRVLRNASLKLEARELIIHDQFQNLYVVFVAQLVDSETYAVPVWVGSMARGLCKEFTSRFKWFDDDMLAYLQRNAFIELGRLTAAILKGQAAAGVTLAPTGGEIDKSIITGPVTAFPTAAPATTPKPVAGSGVGDSLKVIPFPEIHKTTKPNIATS